MNGTTTADKTEKVGITLAITLVNQVDKVRGDIPRSTYIRRAVERYIQGKDATPASLSWFILTPVQATKNLINLLKSMHLNISTQNALISRLNAALQFLSHGPKFNVGACGEFNGFIRQVQGAARKCAYSNTSTPIDKFCTSNSEGFGLLTYRGTATSSNASLRNRSEW